MRRGKVNVVEMLVVGAIASAVGIVGGLLIDWFPAAKSTQSGPIDTLWDVLLIVSIPVFVLVTIVVVYAVKYFRMRPGEENLDGEPIHGSTRLEVIWTAVPSALIAALVVYAYLVLVDIEKAPADGARERRVGVEARQFAWRFTYPEKGADGKPITSTDLYLPVGESVLFEITTPDVLHSFFIPEFRMKIDAVPGLTTRFRTTPTEEGQATVVCAELCGLGHAFMRARAQVLSRSDFDRWVAKQGMGMDMPAGGGGMAGKPSAADGKALFTNGNGTAQTCAVCHTLAAAGSQASTGPNLDKALADVAPAAIREMIVAPDKDIAEGFSGGIMPQDYEQTLSAKELDALVNYLDKVTSK